MSTSKIVKDGFLVKTATNIPTTPFNWVSKILARWNFCIILNSTAIRMYLYQSKLDLILKWLVKSDVRLNSVFVFTFAIAITFVFVNVFAFVLLGADEMRLH